MNPGSRERFPLEGVRVLDFAGGQVSFCSRLLADMGACVIKVEPPGGDPSRETGPFWGDLPHPERSLSFWYANAGKHGITLDIDHREGRNILKKLALRADVLVESFAPGHLESLEMGYDVLGRLNPGLILVSVTGFGQEGPRRLHAWDDLVACACGGQMHVTGCPELHPLKAFGGQPSYTASLFAALGTLLALKARRRNGKGDHLDISLQDAVAATLDHVFVRFFDEKVAPKRRGSLHWDHAFCIFPCRDGFVHLTLFHQWETLVEWMARDGMAADLADPGWNDPDLRLRHAAHIIDVVSRWTKTYTVQNLFETGQLMGFPWAPVCTLAQVAQSPQLEAREFFMEIEHPEMGRSLKYPRLPYRFSISPAACRKRAPLIGEDNPRIYGKELGLGKEELARLASMGVI